MKRCTWLLLFLAAMGWGGTSDALTVYRIGGADLRPPELDAPFEFVQIKWEAVDSKVHGGTVQMALSPEAITPQQLDPMVNLTPLLNDRGGSIETLQTIVGFAKFPARDAPMFDGDPATHFLGDGDLGGDYGRVKNKLLIFDLGGNFIIDRIKFYPRDRFLDTRFIERFVIGISDGDPLKVNTPDLPWRREEPLRRRWQRSEAQHLQPAGEGREGRDHARYRKLVRLESALTARPVADGGRGQ
jgi:hypothetical protein